MNAAGLGGPGSNQPARGPSVQTPSRPQLRIEPHADRGWGPPAHRATPGPASGAVAKPFFPRRRDRPEGNDRGAIPQPNPPGTAPRRSHPVTPQNPPLINSFRPGG